VGCVIFAGYQGHTLFRNNDIFTLRKVTVRGNKLVNVDYLYSIAEPFLGMNMFEIDFDDLKLRYQAVSRLENIRFQRIYPSRLVITVRERQGVFYVRDNQGGFHPIDRDKFVLDKADWYLDEDLPLINIPFPSDRIVMGQQIVDPRIDYIYKVYDMILVDNPTLARDISEFYFRDNNLFFVDIRSGSRVILGAEHITEQINRFIFLRENQGFNRNSTIDLRFYGQIIVT
jgi:cell division protein FtsQ